MIYWAFRPHFSFPISALLLVPILFSCLLIIGLCRTKLVVTKLPCQMVFILLFLAICCNYDLLGLWRRIFHFQYLLCFLFPSFFLAYSYWDFVEQNLKLQNDTDFCILLLSPDISSLPEEMSSSSSSSKVFSSESQS